LSGIRAAIVVLALSAAGAAGGDAPYRLEDYRSIGEPVARPTKILVIALASDPQVRNRFEDKFVTHLRGREIGATASHAIVPSLTEPEAREKVLAAIEKEGLDGVMTVRAVGLDDAGEAGWVAEWQTWLAGESTVRQLVERTLPMPSKRAKKYGIEFALWGGTPGRRLWAARTGVCTRKDLESGVGDLLQLAIDGLKDSRWL
jgi:hypothetical protein